MKSKFLLVFLLILSSNFIFSQEVQTLPRDPRIKTGKMPNGFTYYLVKNDKMKGFADFYLVQKVGSALESESQKGLTAMIGNMGVRGTRNFPDYTIMYYMDQLGMEAGKDFRIINDYNNSVYRMANVPVGRSKMVVDSTLLILFNWACSINIDEEDVQNEKSYYKNSFVQSMGVERRTNAAHIRNLFPGTGFTVPVADTMLEKIDSYSSKDIRKYYYKWYRPELQALVVVGDIDSLSMDTQIKTLFQATPRYLDKVEQKKPYISPSSGLKVSMATDREASACSIDIYFKTPPIPAFLRKSAVPFVMDYMNDMMAFLVQDRLRVMASNSDIPIMEMAAEYGSYLQIGEMESLHINAKTSPEYSQELVQMITRELYGIKNNGFSREEFLTARDRYYKHLNYVYDWRIYTTNDIYAERCIKNYLGGYSLASIEMNKEYMDVVWYEVGLSQFNTFVSSYLRNGDNTTITCSFPRNSSSDTLSAEKIEDAFRSAMKESAAQVSFNPIVEELSLGEIKPGTIISESREPITNSLMWTLSNGATVLFKSTQSEPNKVVFNAVAKGGLSLLNGNVSLYLRYINDIASLESLGPYDPVQIRRYMDLHRMSLRKEMSLSTNRLYGNFSSGDMKGFLELIHLHFNTHSVQISAFERYKTNKTADLLYSNNNPEYLFADSLTALMYNRSRFSPLVPSQRIDDVDLSSVSSFIDKSFSNAANFTFMFVGDADEALLKEYVCKYIGSLPGNPNKKETWRIVPFYLQKRNINSHMKVDMELHRSIYNMTIAGASPFSSENMAVSTIISNIIEKRVRFSLLERGINADIHTEFRKYPEEFMTISFSFVTHDYSEQYIEYINETLRDLESYGADSHEIKTAKSVINARSSFREITDNTFWTEILTSRFIDGKDFYSKQAAIIETLPQERINDALSRFLDGCSHIVLTMSPKE